MRSVVSCAIVLLCIVPVVNLQAQSQPTNGALYTLDKQHSLLDFTARHIGFGRVRGTFKQYRAAAFLVPEDLEQTTFTATIEVRSIDTGTGGRDGILKNEFFDAENHPYILFQSTRLEKQGDGFLVTGSLTMRDVTKEVQIPVRVITLDGQDQWQHKRIVLEGELTVNRKDFNLIYDNDFWDAIVDDEIRIDISFGARHYNALNTIFPWRDNGIGTVIRNTTAEAGFEAARQRVRDLWENHRTDYHFKGIYRQWPSSFYRAGIAFAQEGKFEEAIGVFNLALEIHKASDDPQYISDLYAYRGQVFMMAGRADKAEESLNTALAHDAHNPVALELMRHVRD